MRVWLLMWLVGCTAAPPILDGVVPLPSGAKKLCSGRSPHGAPGDDGWSPLAQRAMKEEGGAFDYTAYVLPPPLVFNASNVAVRHFIDALPPGTSHPAFRHRAPVADSVVMFAAPSDGGARFAWLVELYSGVKPGHPFTCGTSPGKDEVLVLVARPYF